MAQEDDETKSRSIQAVRDAWVPQELVCEEFDPPLDDDAVAKIRSGAASEEFAFECEQDWIQTEAVLQPILPQLGEPNLAHRGGLDENGGIIALREVVLAYSSVSAVRSVTCHFSDLPQSGYEMPATGGMARYSNLWEGRPDEEIGIWEQLLSASDCEFVKQKIRRHDPDDIVHRKPYGNPLTESGTIILVHGRSFKEFVDHHGEYSVKLRPGLTEPADPLSEQSEAALDLMLDYFAHRARAEGTKRELPVRAEAVDEVKD